MVLLGVKCCIIAICKVVPDFGSMCYITLSSLNGVSEKNQTERAVQILRPSKHCVFLMRHSRLRC